MLDILANNSPFFFFWQLSHAIMKQRSPIEENKCPDDHLIQINESRKTEDIEGKGKFFLIVEFQFVHVGEITESENHYQQTSQ